jgi:ketosteroid isomerase-like protein
MTASDPAATSRGISDEAQISELITRRVRACDDKDAAALAAGYADDVLIFDAVGPLRQAGAAAHADRVAEWLAFYRGGMDYQIRDLEISAGSDVGYCHYLYRVGGTTTGGENIGMWLRSTVCVRKVDHAWTITHEHTSVPFDGADGAASLDLLP